MAKLLTPKLLRRGFEIFFLASLIGFGALPYYSNHLGALPAAIPRCHGIGNPSGRGPRGMTDCRLGNTPQPA